MGSLAHRPYRLKLLLAIAGGLTCLFCIPVNPAPCAPLPAPSQTDPPAPDDTAPAPPVEREPAPGSDLDSDSPVKAPGSETETSPLKRKLDLQMKGGDLRELAVILTEKTGIRFTVAKELEDRKLTALVRECPLGDLMNQVARLYTLRWRVYGEGEKGRRYHLYQALKDKGAEDTSADDDEEMFASLVAKLKAILPFADGTMEESSAEIKSLEGWRKQATDPTERQRLQNQLDLMGSLTQENRDAAAVFSVLTPEQIAALKGGQTLTLGFKGDPSDNTGLPPATVERWHRELAENYASSVFFSDDKTQPAFDQTPKTFTTTVTLALDRSQPQQLGLDFRYEVRWKSAQGNIPSGRSGATGDLHGKHIVLTAAPDRTQRPVQGPEELALKGLPPFDKTFVLEPEPEIGEGEASDPEAVAEKKKWVTASEVFSEIHRKTGLNLIADDYTRIYPKSSFRSSSSKLSEALNAAAERLRSDWWSEGNFLRFRRTDYTLERELDVPNRLLKKWSAARKKNGHLTLEELSEAAGLGDPILMHEGLKQALLKRYDIAEWPLALRSKRELRFYAVLDPEQRRLARQPDGLSLSAFSPGQLAQGLETLDVDTQGRSSEELRNGGFYIRLKPFGAYEWVRGAGHIGSAAFPAPPVEVHESTREAAVTSLAALMKSRRTGEKEIEEAKSHISGPDPEIYCRLQLGGSYFLREGSVMSIRRKLESIASGIFDPRM